MRNGSYFFLLLGLIFAIFSCTKQDPNIPTEAYYVIRFVKAASGEIIWISVVLSSYSGDRERVIFNSDGFASIDFLQTGIDYQWRVDIIGSESHSGSESGWVPIRLQ